MNIKFKPVSIALGLVLGWAAVARAESAPPVFDVWPGKAPSETRTEKPEVSPKNGNITRVSNVFKPTLTLYHAPESNDTGAAVVIAPGGGYSILAWDLEGTEVAQWLNSVGVTAVLLKYRVPEPRPTQTEGFPPLEDAQRAISLVRSKAAEWKIDPQRIGMLGFSAGGNLTALACTNFDHRAYAPTDATDRVSCRPDFGILIYPAWLIEKGKDELQPIFPVTAQTPQMFMVQANDDPINAENVAVMYLALKHAKVPAEVHIYSKGGHGFGLRPTANPCSTWPARCAEWMKVQGLLQKK